MKVRENEILKPSGANLPARQSSMQADYLMQTYENTAI